MTETLSLSDEESVCASFCNAKRGCNTKDKFSSRHALGVFASLYTFAFVGALYGWGPMQRLLESSGAFSYKCSSTTNHDDVCPEQSQTLINLGLMATCLSVVTPIIGHAIDEYGASTVSYFMGSCALLGSGLLVAAAASGRNWLYWVCFALLGLTTFTGSLLSVQVGLYFVGRTQVRIVMWLNTLFDAGSVSYLFLWIIQESLGLSFVTIALLYFTLALLLFVPAAYLWTIAEPETECSPFEPDECEPIQPETHSDAAQSETMGSVAESLRLFMESKMDYTLLSEVVSSRRGSLGSSVRGSVAITDEPHQLPPAYVYGSIPDDRGSFVEDDDGTEYVLLSEKSAIDQLVSVPFIMLNVFFSLSMISCSWSLITAADFLAALGDDGTYLKIFTLMQPASILFLPLVDWIVNHYGFGTAFQAVNLINFVYILIKCTSTNLRFHVVTFLMVAAVRCFLYATTFSFLPLLLSADVVGRGTGLLAMIGGLASFLNIPLNALASGGDFLTPNLIYLFAVIPCTFAVRSVQKTINRERDIKQSRENGDVTKVGSL